MLDLNLLPFHQPKLSEHCVARAVHKSTTSSDKNGIRSSRMLDLSLSYAIYSLGHFEQRHVAFRSLSSPIHKDGASNLYLLWG